MNLSLIGNKNNTHFFRSLLILIVWSIDKWKSFVNAETEIARQVFGNKFGLIKWP